MVSVPSHPVRVVTLCPNLYIHAAHTTLSEILNISEKIQEFCIDLKLSLNIAYAKGGHLFPKAHALHSVSAPPKNMTPNIFYPFMNYRKKEV